MEKTIAVFDTAEACTNYINSIPRNVSFYLHHYASGGGYIGSVEVPPKEVLRICRLATNQLRLVEFLYYQDTTLFITIKSNK